MSKSLIDVVEDLLNQDINEASYEQNEVNKKNLTSDGKTADSKTVTPSADQNSSEFAANQERNVTAGPEVDSGEKGKGEFASDASDNSKEVGIGAPDVAPLDSGADKDAGPAKDGKKAFPSDASAEVEADKGPHDQSKDEAVEIEDDEEAIEEKKMDAVGKEDGDVDNDGDKDSSDEYLMKRRNAIAKAMKKEDAVEESEEVVAEESEEEMEEGKLPPALQKKADEMKAKMKEEKDEDDDDDDDDKDDDKKDMDESSEESVEESFETWDWDKISELEEDAFNQLVSELDDAELAEFAEHFGIDDEEVVEEDAEEVEEATGEKLETPTAATNDAQRPSEEKGDNMPEEKGGSHDASDHKPHVQANDPHDTPINADKAKDASTEDGKGTAPATGEKIAKAGMSEESEEEMTPEAELEEEFKRKAEVVFESAVNEKVASIRETLEEEFEAKFAKVQEETLDNVNEYVEYAIQEWISENQLEIKYSLRTEVAENFIRSLKGVFEENFIDIPEEEVSVVDEMTETLESMKEQNDENMSMIESLQAEVLEFKRASIVSEVAEGLTETQKIRLEKLSETVEANDIDEFRSKLSDLSESYFAENSASSAPLDEEVIGTDETITEDVNTTVGAYAQFLSKTTLK